MRVSIFLLLLVCFVSSGDAWANRYYSPETGRFISRDPIGYYAGFNLFAYTLDAPVNYVDPLGYDFVDDFLDSLPDMDFDPVEALGGKLAIAGALFTGKISAKANSSHWYVDVKCKYKVEKKCQILECKGKVYPRKRDKKGKAKPINVGGPAGINIGGDVTKSYRYWLSDVNIKTCDEKTDCGNDRCKISVCINLKYLDDDGNEKVSNIGHGLYGNWKCTVGFNTESEGKCLTLADWINKFREMQKKKDKAGKGSEGKSGKKSEKE